jgi:HAD superfamily hydrolase (TIGR01509 family)
MKPSVYRVTCQLQQGFLELWNDGWVSVIRAVLFDWRGTLAVVMSEQLWVERALARLGEDAANDSVPKIIDDLERAAALPEFENAWARLDCDAEFHRQTYHRVFAAAGIRPDLADALYEVESDPDCNPFANDVGQTLRALNDRGLKIAVVSDIHFDLRPTFDKSALLELVEAFVLSFEHGVQKPDPPIFRIALDELGVEPQEALMVGDRAAYDGAAIALGMLPSKMLPMSASTSL